MTNARPKDKIAAAVQGMFPAPSGKEEAAMVRQWEESVAVNSIVEGKASAASAAAEPDRDEEKAVELAKRMNAITARKQVRERLPRK